MPYSSTTPDRVYYTGSSLYMLNLLREKKHVGFQDVVLDVLCEDCVVRAQENDPIRSLSTRRSIDNVGRRLREAWKLIKFAFQFMEPVNFRRC